MNWSCRRRGPRRRSLVSTLSHGGEEGPGDKVWGLMNESFKVLQE